MGRRKMALPSAAEDFLATDGGRWAERVVRLFHHWLERQQLGLEMLTQTHVDRFLRLPSSQPIKARTRNDYRYKLRRYLHWLDARGHIDLDTHWLSLRSARRRVMPPQAEEFLAGLEPTLRPATCQQYRNSLYQLYDWLDDQGVDLHQADRRHFKAWCQHLHKKGQAPATRVNVTVHPFFWATSVVCHTATHEIA